MTVDRWNNKTSLPRGLETYRVGSLSVLADPMGYAGRDRVLPIITDEQPLICKFLSLKGNERVIDAGTGSGVLALHAASQGCRAVGVDVLPRAIAVASENMRRNGLDVHWRCERYAQRSADAECADVVVFNPPHHPTPPGFEVAVHADGGSDGLDVFREFLGVAALHIVREGRIVFFQLSPSREGQPKALERLHEFFSGGFEARFLRVLPTVSHEWFLTQVYENAYAAWIKTTTSGYPDLSLIIGEIIKGGNGKVVELPARYTNDASWQDRVKLHRAIVASGSSVSQ